MGRRMGNLKKALGLLGQCGVQTAAVSSVYKTGAVSKIIQPYFYNICIKIHTGFSAQKLLQVCMMVESEMGRKRIAGKRAGYEKPRIIDLDILMFNREIIRKRNLTIPHKKMHERKFVLEPLCDIASAEIYPVLKKTVKQLLKQCSDDSIVRLQGKITKF